LFQTVGLNNGDQLNRSSDSLLVYLKGGESIHDLIRQKRIGGREKNRSDKNVARNGSIALNGHNGFDEFSPARVKVRAA
jgi:hypothetical protein